MSHTALMKGRYFRSPVGALWAVLVLTTGAALGQPAAEASNDSASFAPVAVKPAAPAVLSRLDMLRTLVARALPAPRVSALVNQILPADVQVVVVRSAPGGIGAYYAGVVARDQPHVYANPLGRLAHQGSPGLIVLDALLEDEASTESIAFVLAHEFAHHQLDRGHTELLADAYARRLLERHGLWSPQAAEDAFKAAFTVPWKRWLVPAVAERLRAIREQDPALRVANATP